MLRRVALIALSFFILSVVPASADVSKTDRATALAYSWKKTNHKDSFGKRDQSVFTIKFTKKTTAATKKRLRNKTVTVTCGGGTAANGFGAFDMTKWGKKANSARVYFKVKPRAGVCTVTDSRGAVVLTAKVK